MGSWGFWEFLGYGTIAIAAVQLALDTSMKSSPNLAPRTSWFRETPMWGFAPIVLLAIAGLVVIGNQLGWVGQKITPGDGRPISQGSGGGGLEIGIGAEIRGPISVTDKGIVIFSVAEGQDWKGPMRVP